MPREYYVNNPENGSRGERFGDLDLEASNIAFSASAEFALGGDWRLVPQVQWMSNTRDARDSIGGTTLDQDWDSWLPRVGLVFQPSDSLRLFTNLSASREAPTYWEIVQAEVPPVVLAPGMASVSLNEMKEQSAVSLEIGGSGRLGEFADWEVAVYRSELEDEILSVASTFGVIAQSSNYDDDTVHQGIESSLRGSLPVGPGELGYRASWTYSDFYFRDGTFDGNQIAGVPVHVLSGRVKYRVAAFTVGANVYSQPNDNYVDHANTLEQDSFALLGLEFSYDPVDDLRLFLNINNVTDKTYNASYVVRDNSTAELPTFLPGVGREVIGGLSYRW